MVRKYGDIPNKADELDKINHELLPQITSKITGAKFHLDNDDSPRGRRRARHILDSCSQDCDEAKSTELKRIEREGRTPGQGP